MLCGFSLLLTLGRTCGVCRLRKWPRIKDIKALQRREEGGRYLRLCTYIQGSLTAAKMLHVRGRMMSSNHVHTLNLWTCECGPMA